MVSQRYPLIGIAGTINHDFIKTGGYEYEDLGGILYNILGFHYLSDGKISIKPTANYGYDIKTPLFDYLKDKNNILPQGLSKINSLNPTVRLTDIGTEGKSEVLKHFLPVLSYDQLLYLNNCDIILINFISGRDAESDTLRKLRESYHGIIYIDIHSLTLGIRQDGSRYYRQPECWKQILGIADIVQMNLKETLTLLGEVSKSPDSISDDGIVCLGESILSYGPNIFILTLGHKGATLFKKQNNQTGIFRSVSGNLKSTNGEATGCGDIFTSAFIVSILSDAGLQKSLDYSVAVASEKYKSPGLKQISLLNTYACSIPTNVGFSIDNVLSK
ncbi:MAG: carbohydrate kinase family protein [candidate division Zixibacteria bacterium]|nr:carbohydrate kinase family protein [candidate division Zixibacteria bacterium]